MGTSIPKPSLKKTKKKIKIPKIEHPKISRLKDDLDFIFSWYIRLKDVKNGLVSCFTCNKQFEPIDIQAGHYWSRSNSIIRWSEENVKPQCSMCNCSIYGGGKPQVFACNLTRVYGGEVLQRLEDLKKISAKLKWWDLQNQIIAYKIEVKDLLEIHKPIRISKKLEKFLLQ